MRLAAAGATAAVLAGCSSDVSRLAEGPFSQADHTPTASIGGARSGNALVPPDSVSSGAPATSVASAPASNAWSSGPIQSQPLAAPVSSAPLPPPQSAPYAAPQTASRTPAAAPGMPTRPTYTSPALAARPSAPAASSASPAGASHGPWTAAGGTSVTVAQGDSASVLAARYGVPQEALLKVNGLSSAAQVTPGARLTIPVYNASAPRQTAT
ncbi:MAG TPA: LysM peptidoglycan-binding domain-containing protein, partial [Beijerinckiaceae bacterium]